MLEFMPANVLPSTETKIDYVKVIINLFPKLKDRNSTLGYEAFFNPVTKQGFLTTRLRNLFRDKRLSKSCPEIEEDEIINKIEVLKTLNQKDETTIYTLTKETFAYRSCHRQDNDLIQKYPRFLDTVGLISFEFGLLHEGKKNNFLNTFQSNVKVVKEVYKNTITSLQNTLLIDSDTDNDDWDSVTKTLIILLHLLPPTASKKNRKTSVEKAADKLIVFIDEQEPLQSILDRKPS
ncbi:hypothetical protein ILUMI_12582, partial [Ignelater luminosus]